MRKAFTAMAAISAVAAGAAVLQLKFAVQEQAERVQALSDQIHDDREAMRYLEAEWAYLTSPQALQDLSIEFLALMPPLPDQVIGSVEDIPHRRGADVPDDDTSVLLPSARKTRTPGVGAGQSSGETTL